MIPLLAGIGPSMGEQVGEEGDLPRIPEVG